MDDTTEPSASIVSIILPTYNRARFLPQAFASIRSQTFTDWDLIVVDDGSTDGSREIVDNLSKAGSQSVKYIRQQNQGAYGARNTGLDHARGQFIAFYDSDDVWLAHHLADCVRTLQADPSLSIVYGASRMIEMATAKVLAPNTFYVEGKPRPFLRLTTHDLAGAKVIEDPDLVYCMLTYGLYCGLQNSVFHRRVFDNRRFRYDYRPETEDGMFFIRCFVAGFRIAYLDNVHVLYNVHGDNSSAVSGTSIAKHIHIQEAFARGFDELKHDLNLSRRELKALHRAQSSVYFWNLGYRLYWQTGQKDRALAMFHKGLRTWPWNLGYWKTYFLALIKSVFTNKGNSRKVSAEPE